MINGIKNILLALKHSGTYLFGVDASRRPAVEQYPDVISARTKEDLFPRAKGFLDNDLSVCNGCGDCLSACSVKALEMDSTMTPDGAIVVESFRIDLGRCYSCSVCVEICPVSSLRHTNEFELSVASPAEMVLELRREHRELPAFVGKLRDMKKLRSYEARR